MSKPSRRPRAGRRPSARLMLPAGETAPALLAAAKLTGAAGVPVAITWRTFQALIVELGSGSAAWTFVARVAAESGRPVFANGPRQDGTDGSTTVAIPPPSWTQEKLNGFVAGMKDEIEDWFGRIEGRPEWPGKAA